MSSRYVEHGARGADRAELRAEGVKEADDDRASFTGAVSDSDDDSVHTSDKEFVAAEHESDSGTDDEVGARARAEAVMDARRAAAAAAAGGAPAATLDDAGLPTKAATAADAAPLGAVGGAGAQRAAATQTLLKGMFHSVGGSGGAPVKPPKPPTAPGSAPPPPPTARTVPTAAPKPPAPTYAPRGNEDNDDDDDEAQLGDDESDSGGSSTKGAPAAKRAKVLSAKALAGGRKQRFLSKTSAQAPPPPPDFDELCAAAADGRAADGDAVLTDPGVAARVIISNGSTLLNFLACARRASRLSLYLHKSAEFEGIKITMYSDRDGCSFALRGRFRCTVQRGHAPDGSVTDVNAAVLCLPMAQLQQFLECAVHGKEPIQLTLYAPPSAGPPAAAHGGGKRARAAAAAAKEGLELQRLQYGGGARDSVSKFLLKLLESEETYSEEDIQALELEARRGVMLEVSCREVSRMILKPASALKVEDMELHLALAQQGDLLHSQVRLSFSGLGCGEGETAFYACQRVRAPPPSQQDPDGGRSGAPVEAVEQVVTDDVLDEAARDALPWRHAFSMAFGVDK